MNRDVLGCLILAMWVWGLCTGVAFAGTGAPDLEPEEGVFGFRSDDPYRATVAELLLGGERYRKCEMVFMPAFDKESAVYILRKDDGQDAKATVVSVEMKLQLWSEMTKFQMKEGDGKSYTDASEGRRRALARVSREVRRTEAEIDARTADLLEKTWQAMLSRVRYSIFDMSRNLLGRDGESSHAAHYVEGAGYMTGKTWSPHEGTRTYDFVNLAKVLRNFTRSDGATRETILRDVVTRAEALLKRLSDGN